MLWNLFKKKIEQIKNKKVSTTFYKDLIVPYRITHPDFGWMDRCKSKRQNHQPIFQALLTDIQEEYFFNSNNLKNEKHQTILELGTGLLNDQQQSYLSQFFPKALTSQWTFSDHSGVASHYQNKNIKYLNFNLLDENPDSLKQPFDHIVACNVLDTLPYSELPRVLKKIHGLLKSGQCFFHFADLEFYYNSFIDACIDKDTVLFPVKNNKIYQIKKSDYQTALDKKKSLLSSTDYQFLDTWGKRETAKTALIINDLILSPINYDCLTKKVEALFKELITIMGSSEKFHRNLAAASKNEEWKILEFGFHAIEEPYQENSEQKKLINTNIHVFIAQKI